MIVLTLCHTSGVTAPTILYVKQPSRDREGVDPTLKRDPLPHGRGFHEKAGPCQAKSGGLRGLAPWRSMRQRLICAPSSAPSASRPSTPVSADQREADRQASVHRGPLSLFIATSSERRRFVK